MFSSIHLMLTGAAQAADQRKYGLARKNGTAIILASPAVFHFFAEIPTPSL